MSNQNQADLYKVISAHDHAVRTTSDDHRDKPVHLSNLGSAATLLFEKTGDVAHLNKAIEAHQTAVELTKDNQSQKPARLNDLGSAAALLFEKTKDVAHLEKAIEAHQAAVDLTPDSQTQKPARLNDLGGAAALLFEQTRDVDHLHKAIEAHQIAVELTPDNQSQKPARLNDLGSATTLLFEQTKDVVHLEKAIEAHQTAVDLTPDNQVQKPARLNDLASATTLLFEQTGDVAHLDKAIDIHEAAVELTPDSQPQKPARLNDLGNSIALRFEKTEDVNDLNKAIDIHEAAVDLTPADNSRKPARLSDFGGAVLHRFEHLGAVADVDRSIATHEDAVQLADDEQKPALLSNLGNSILRRFERVGDVADLNQSITAFEDATRLLPDDQPAKAETVNNLGDSFLRRFEAFGDTGDVDLSITAFRDAVRLTPDDHPAKQTYLNHLGGTVLLRFTRLGDLTDIDESITAFKDVLRLTPDDHPSRPVRLNNLGAAYLSRFNRSENVADVDNSISQYTHAVELTPDGHPDKATTLISLGGSYMSRFTRLNQVGDLNAAILHFSIAARSTGPPSIRFRAALEWATCCHQADTSPLDAYSSTFDLLPRIAWLGLTQATREQALAGIEIVIRTAAAAAVASGEFRRALEWLEQGHSIVLGLSLNLRSPVDDLRAKDPSLADRIEQLSLNLERSGTQDDLVDPSHQLSLEEVAQKRRRLALQWDSLIEAITAVPGFEDFLKPKTFSQLRSAARFGPVVVINVHIAQSDALVVLADHGDVIHVPLRDFSVEQEEKLQQSLAAIVSAPGMNLSASDRHSVQGQNNHDREFKRVLSELWLQIVKPVLERLALPTSRDRDPPRIWWCVTGLLAFLPVHAAGLYGTDEQGSKITDFVVSSYTPTLTALLDAPRTSRADTLEILVVNEPPTSGRSSRSNAAQELALIQRHAGNHPIRGLEGVGATKERVVECMKKCSWIHLACPSTQVTEGPAGNALILHDGPLKLSEIVKTLLPDAEFAFLSASHIAINYNTLGMEDILSATGMSLAGYRGVIAATWAVGDEDVSFVVEDVYARLFKDHRPDRTRAAHALHHAVQRLRQQKGASFISWVPFIHVGL